MKKAILVMIIVSVVGALAFSATEVSLALPVVITSAGQSTEVETVTYVADEVGLKYDYCDISLKDELAAGVGLGGAVSAIGKHVTTLSLRSQRDEVSVNDPGSWCESQRYGSVGIVCRIGSFKAQGTHRLRKGDTRSQ